MIKLLLIFLLLVGTASAEVSDISSDELKMFLFWDDTDMNEYTQSYDCDYFVRDAARSALKFNITLGGVILSNDYEFKGETHAMNYIYVDGEMVVIEPQTDEFYPMHEIVEYRYVKFFPLGVLTPSVCYTNWSPDLDLVENNPVTFLQNLLFNIFQVVKS